MTMSLIFLLLKTSPNNEAIIDSARSVNRLFYEIGHREARRTCYKNQRFDKKKKTRKIRRLKQLTYKKR